MNRKQADSARLLSSCLAALALLAGSGQGALIASFDVGDAVAPTVPAPVTGPAGTAETWAVIHAGNYPTPPSQNGVKFFVSNGTGFTDSRAGNDLLSDYVYELNGGNGANWRLEGLVAGTTYELYLLAADGTGSGANNTYDTTFTVFDGDPGANGSGRSNFVALATATVHPVNTGSGFEGVWVEGVNFARLTFRANASVMYGLYELASGGAHSGIAGIQLVAGPAAPGLFWSFSQFGEFNGWGPVSQGAQNEPKLLVRNAYSGGMNSSPVLSSAYRVLGWSGYVGDSAHAPLIIRSPHFRITEATSLTWRCVGGNASSVDPGTGTNAYPAGAQGIALVRARDGNRMLSQPIAVTGTPAVLQFDVSPFAGDGEAYYLEVVDQRSGPRGFIECDDFLVPGERVAEGPDIQLQALYSDNTWRTAASSVPFTADWVYNLAYDDTDAAGWTNAVIDVANRIWHTSGSSASGPAHARFRKIFHIPRKVYAAYAVFAVDDDADFFINGTLVWHDPNGSASETYWALDPALFQVGDNLVAVDGYDSIASTHVIAFEVLLQLEPEPVVHAAVPPEGEALRIDFENLDLNQAYVVQRATHLLGLTAWQDVTNFSAQQFATNWIYPNSGGAPGNYFRLREAIAPQSVTGLRGFYPFNGNADDESGNHFDGIVSNAILATDRFGQPNGAYYFDGTAAHIRVRSDVLSVYTYATFAAWAKVQAGGSALGALVSKPRDSGGDASTAMNISRENFSTPGGRSGFGFLRDTPNAVTFISGVSVDDGAWHLVVGTSTPTNVTLYVDGMFQTSASFAWGNAASSEDVMIGQEFPNPASSYGKRSFRGTIDEVWIYNRPLSAAEVSDLYLATRP